MFLKRGLTLSLVLSLIWAACAGVRGPVEPSIAVEPAAGTAGTEVVVTGEGFPAGVEIDVRLGPPDVGASPEAYATAITTEHGGFVTSFVMPSMWPDETPIAEGELLIIALVSDGSVKATAPYDYRPPPSPTPELRLDPPNGKPGQRLVVTGTNFWPGPSSSTWPASNPRSDLDHVCCRSTRGTSA